MSVTKEQEMESSILPGLPDDLALLCLVRVPRRCHIILSMVCKHWKNLLGGWEYNSLRRKMSLMEVWVYALSRDRSEILHWHALDPLERRWRRLPPMPGSFPQHYGLTSAVLGHQLFVLGGGKKYQNPTAEVIKYDPSTNEWREVADMDTARCYFVCATFQDRLYAVGGMGTSTGILTSWEVYDCATDSWSSFQDPNIVSDLGECLVHDKRLYIRHIAPGNFQYIPPSYAAMFNPEVNSWSPIDNDMTREWRGPAVVTSAEEVCMLDQNFGLKVMILDKESLTWSALGRLEPISAQPPCRVSAVGQNLYVVGRGLRTTVLNLDIARHADGVLVASSFGGPTKTNDLTLTCHVLEL